MERLWEGFFARLLIGMLGAAVVLSVALAAVLGAGSGDALRESVETDFVDRATTRGDRIDAWLFERQGDMAVVSSLVGRERSLDGSSVRRLLTRVDKVYGAYDVVEVAAPDGRVLSSSRPDRVEPRGQAWFATALQRDGVFSPVYRDGDVLRLVVSHRIVDTAGRVRAVVLGDLRESAFFPFIKEAKGSSVRSLVVDDGNRVLFNSAWGLPRDSAEVLRAGALRENLAIDPVRRGLAGERGATEGEVSGSTSLVGFGQAKRPRWAVLVAAKKDVALASLTDQRNSAIMIVLVGIALTTLFALLFARSATRPLKALADTARRVAEGDLSARVKPEGARETRELGGSFNQMVDSFDGLVGKIRGVFSTSAVELASTAEELSATSTEQSAAATETSATMEELARTSRSIAESVAAVAEQTATTRESIAQADDDIQASSQRTLALADRVGEIGVILGLINDIADQTNLLALNAAIEAARAGDSGAGFAVVADEVRSLAERSKRSAKEISVIVASTQTETNATVMAMEKGSKQLREGLDLMEAVTDSTTQVRYTTEQQGAAASEVVDTMAALTEGSRQVSSAIEQVASAAAELAELAGDLERSASPADAARPHAPPYVPPPQRDGRGAAQRPLALPVSNGAPRSPAQQDGAPASRH